MSKINERFKVLEDGMDLIGGNVDILLERAELDGVPLKSIAHPGNLSAESIETLEIDLPDDPWVNRSEGMRCQTCMWFVNKEPAATGIGRCRRRAPTMNGYPAVYQTDWCGDHKIK